MSHHPENWGTRVTVRFLKIEQLDALVGDDGRQQQWPKPTRSSVITNLVSAEFAKRNLDAAPITKKTVEKNATLFDDRQLEAFEKTVKKIATATDVVEKRLKEKKPARRRAVRRPSSSSKKKRAIAPVRHRRSAKRKVAKKKGGRR